MTAFSEAPAPSSRSRLGAALAALLAGPALLLLDTGVALAGGWIPRSGLYRAVAAACAAAVVLGLAAALLPAGRRWLARRWTAALLLAVSALLGLAAAEGAAQALPRWIGGTLAHSRGPGVDRTFRPDPRWISGIQGPSRYTTNAFGIRGGDVPVSSRTFRLLCIGGSTTECTYLDDAETWPHLLQERLAAAGRPAWVGNLGISGYTTIEHLDFLAGDPPLPRLDGAVLLIGINDLIRYLNGSLELGPRPLWRRSALAGALLSFHRRAFLRRLLFEVEDPNGASLVGRRRLRRDAADAGPLPPLDGALREYRDRIAGLGIACRRRGLRCLFLTQPVLWQEGLGPEARASLWMGEDEHGRFHSPAELRRGMDLYNAALLSTCAGLGLECLDLGAMSGREDLFYDDCHFTEAGAREMARTVADYLATPARGRG